MFALLLALLIHPGHHHGWCQPHNPHHRPPCSVVWHAGCASVDPPPHLIDWGGRTPAFPGL